MVDIHREQDGGLTRLLQAEHLGQMALPMLYMSDHKESRELLSNIYTGQTWIWQWILKWKMEC